MSPRNGRPYRTLRDRMREHYAAIGAPCEICSEPINYSLRYPHRMSFSIEHRTPVWAGGSDKDARNLGAAHLSCNAAKGAREGNQLRAARRYQRTVRTTATEQPETTSWRWT